jgi:hypothetical protein
MCGCRQAGSAALREVTDEGQHKMDMKQRKLIAHALPRLEPEQNSQVMWAQYYRQNCGLVTSYNRALSTWTIIAGLS